MSSIGKDGSNLNKNYVLKTQSGQQSLQQKKRAQVASGQARYTNGQQTLHASSAKSKAGHLVKPSGRRSTQPYKSGGSTHSQGMPGCDDYGGVDDDDFEEQYIVSGPTPAVKFKSGHPTSQG